MRLCEPIHPGLHVCIITHAIPTYYIYGLYDSVQIFVRRVLFSEVSNMIVLVLY